MMNYGGYAIAATVSADNPQFKTDFQRLIDEDDVYAHAMRYYAPHITVARELPGHRLLSALKLLPDEPFQLDVDGLMILDEPAHYNLIALSVQSSRLNGLNLAIRHSCHHNEHFPFHPHMTLQCLKKATVFPIESLIDSPSIKRWLDTTAHSLIVTGYVLYTPTGEMHCLQAFT